MQMGSLVRRNWISGCLFEGRMGEKETFGSGELGGGAAAQTRQCHQRPGLLWGKTAAQLGQFCQQALIVDGDKGCRGSPALCAQQELNTVGIDGVKS
jgi:hypothetical protein